MAWTTPITFVAAAALTAAQMNANVRDNTNALADRIQEVYKSADETVNNSATLQNDNELLFTAVAGQKYLFTLNLIATSASNTPDFVPAFTFPTGTMNWLGIGLDTAATTSIGSVRIAGATAAVSGAAGPAFGLVSSTSGLQISGSFACTTGGTVQFQWAQSVATVADMTVKLGSSLQAIRVSV